MVIANESLKRTCVCMRVILKSASLSVSVCMSVILVNVFGSIVNVLIVTRLFLFILFFSYSNAYCSLSRFVLTRFALSQWSNCFSLL